MTTFLIATVAFGFGLLAGATALVGLVMLTDGPAYGPMGGGTRL